LGNQDQRPTSFLTLEPGAPVVDRFGRPVGKVRRVLLLETGGFDGIIVRTRAGSRFVDAPEVRRISGDAVTLGIAVADVVSPSAHFHRVYGVPAARHDRTEVTEADRDQAIDCLKRAYVKDELTTDQLAERVAIVHEARKLEQLDAALDDVSVI
jgi:hypothetical protein